MENLINKAQELNRALEIELKNAQDSNSEAKQMAYNARQQKNRLDAKEIELNEREKSLKQCEDPVQAAASAKQLKVENKGLAAQIEEEKQALVKQKRDFAIEMQTQRQKVKEAQADVDSARENFKKKLAQLEEDRANMKNKIIEELKAKL